MMAAASFISLSGPLPYVRCHITVNVLSVSLNKTFPSFVDIGLDGAVDKSHTQNTKTGLPYNMPL